MGKDKEVMRRKEEKRGDGGRRKKALPAGEGREAIKRRNRYGEVQTV